MPPPLWFMPASCSRPTSPTARRAGGDAAIADALECSAGTVARVRKRFAQSGLDAVRRFEVTERKTKADFARLLKRIVDEWYPDAERVTLVVDNLSTHKPAVLYEVFEPAEARRLIGRLEFVYTPKHGSWLNMAEIELSVLARQCLDRRIPDMTTLRREVAAWEKER